MRRIGLPWSPELVTRTLIGTGSAVLAARLALEYGVAIMCNGGTHHAHAAHGSGWCIFNDLAVAARAAQRDAGVGQARARVRRAAARRPSSARRRRASCRRRASSRRRAAAAAAAS